MLFRATGKIARHLAAKGGPIVIERGRMPPIGRRTVQRVSLRLREPASPPCKSARPGETCCPKRAAQAFRPKPGIDTRLWDHDPVSLFTNVYRLGHRSQFGIARLLAEVCDQRGAEATN